MKVAVLQPILCVNNSVSVEAAPLTPPESRSCVTRSNRTHKNTVVMVMHIYTNYSTIISAVKFVTWVVTVLVSSNVTGTCIYTRLCVPGKHFKKQRKTTAMCTKIIIQAHNWVLANIKSLIYQRDIFKYDYNIYSNKYIDLCVRRLN